MAASVQFRPHERDLGMVMREVDENLAIFLGLKNIESKGFDEPKSVPIEPVRNDHFIDSKIHTNCYDRLIPQPVNESTKNPTELSCGEGQDARAPEQGDKSVPVVAKRRPLSDRKPTPRAPTPTGQRPVDKPKTSRSSTPAFPSSKPRSSTPGRKSTDLSDSKKVGPTTSKSRPSKSSETQIMKTSSSRRPASASRGRPCSTTKTSSSMGKPRQKSCSPARTRVPNGNAGAKDVEDVNPVVMGTRMVERVVNMRKLAPPKQEDDLNKEKKPSSQSSSGFGRSLSKKSLDMAIRHMGIKGCVRDGLSPVTTTGLSSSSRGARLKVCKSSAIGVLDSPVTSSSDSSKSSSYFLDGRCRDY